MIENESFIYKFNATYSNMTELIHQLKERETARELCERHSLNVSILKPLFKWAMKGYNNKEIAQKIGVHRITIQRYVSTLRKLKECEFQRIYSYVLKRKHNEKEI